MIVWGGSNCWASEAAALEGVPGGETREYANSKDC